MTLRIPKNIFITSFLLTLISCADKSSSTKIPIRESDTTKIMRLLLDSAFYRHNLPDISALTRNNPFGDTIIFRKEIYQGDTNVSRYFPKDLHDIKIKFLTQSQICSLAINLRSDTTYFPNFLEIRTFKKIDTTYEVYLQNTCVIPQVNKDGNYLSKRGRVGNFPCIFGLLCGGGIAMTFIKNGDTLQTRITGRWSD